MRGIKLYHRFLFHKTRVSIEGVKKLCIDFSNNQKLGYSTVSVMFISLTLTNVESRMSRDIFPWN